MGKKYDVVAIVGQYKDRTTGNMKPRYKNVGVVVENANGGLTVLLDKTFNPAGLATPEFESVPLSLFEPRAKDDVYKPKQNYAPSNTAEDDVPY